MPLHLLLQPEPEPGTRDLSWLHRAVHAAEDGVFDAVLAPLPSAAVPAEPSTLLANLVSRTTDIGLVAPVSAQYVAPYNQARMLNTLDNLSVGRAGWRLATSAEDSPAAVHPPTSSESQRERRAAEFVTVLHELWESWAPDAVAANVESGIYVDVDRLHPINHVGEFFRVAGPLNLPRSPQLHPPLFVSADSPSAPAVLARADVVILGAGTGRDVVTGAPLVLRDLAPGITDVSAVDGADGVVLHLSAPGTEQFVADVLPQLRDRGLVRDRYETSTLRGHLGLAAPAAGVPT